MNEFVVSIVEIDKNLRYKWDWIYVPWWHADIQRRKGSEHFQRRITLAKAVNYRFSADSIIISDEIIILNLFFALQSSRNDWKVFFEPPSRQNIQRKFEETYWRCVYNYIKTIPQLDHSKNILGRTFIRDYVWLNHSTYDISSFI